MSSTSRRRTWLTLLATASAAVLFVGSLKLPVWHMKMEAPQYQDKEALRVRVYPGSMQGDLREITVLNQYVGVRIPEHLPQLRWMPIALVAAGLLGLAAVALPRRARCGGLLAVALLLSLTLVGAAGQAQYQMHTIGHERNRHAALKGVQDFTPPLLGEVKIANFEISAGLGVGALLIGAGIALQVGAGLLWRRSEPACCTHAPLADTSGALSAL